MAAWIGIVVQLLPLVIQIMKIIEKLLGSGTGAIKKTFVLDSIQNIFKGSSDAEDTDEVWDKIKSVLSPLIDITCLFLFKDDDEVVEEDQEVTG